MTIACFKPTISVRSILTHVSHRIRCALFGEYVDELNQFLSSGYAEQPVVVLQLAKVKVLEVCIIVGLQNVMFALKLGFNLDIPEVAAFRKRYFCTCSFCCVFCCCCYHCLLI
ncbi:hypothetical protein AHAS_Ahas12G0100100 [Arachis hypogaea]